MAARLGLGTQSRVIEVASNDGYLLQHFVKAGVPVLGIEPAGHAAEVARGRGVETRVAFFNATTAAGLVAEGISADLIAANNVLAHVLDIRGFVAGFPLVLAREGVATFEFPHLLNLIERVQFDTIYHEHYSYLSLLAVEAVLASAGLRVFDVEELPTHGGSLRVFACHRAAAHAERPGLAAVRAREAAAGLASPAPYAGFAARAGALRSGFLDFLGRARAAGLTVAAYGAAAKGNTFLNFCGVGRADIMAVADRNPQKQGRLLPGSHIPIVSPEALIAVAPDRVVILPWNLKDEIAAQLAPLAARGTRLAVIDAGAPGGIVLL
ncbi:class I SAM-dependent methyltransferase [Limibaculum sp. FT325]|nr:class I SAM-dependent methyltransferase [Limibaculum sediminis]MCL5777379.1 class I SAM-dependent methyltransferase [Limibaculum sediminis]